MADVSKIKLPDNTIVNIKDARNVVIGDGLNNVVKLTKAQYDALATKDPNTVYIITDVDGSGSGGGGGSGSGSTVSVTQVVSSGTKIATITVDGSGTDLYSPTETDPVFTASAAHGITSSDITNWNGKTSNTGTITGIKMNGSSKGTSGVVDLGTVITSETSLSKGTTSGSGNAVTDISVSGHKITLTKGSTFLTSYTETDPVFSASAAHGISSTDISNWNAKQKAITVSSSEPTSSQGSNGDIWIVI